VISGGKKTVHTTTRSSMLTRRQGLLAGAAAVAALAVAKRAVADVIADATITGVGEAVKGAKKDGPFRIGFSNGFSGNTWRTMCTTAVTDEAKAHPEIAEFVVVDGQGDITKQVSDIETLISQQVDAILCIPNSGAAVAPVLADATKEGVVTVPFNLPVEGESWSTYVGTDPERKGKALGAWLAKALDGKGKIVALGGLPGNSYTAAAWKGAQESIEGSAIEVLAFKDAYWEEDRAKVVMADLIAAHPQIDGVWCDGAQVGAGAMKALLAANRPLVPVTGDDYNGLLKLYLAQKDKQPRFDIGLMSEPTWQSVVALRAALALLKGEQVAKRQIIQPQLITKANVERFVRLDMPDGVFVDTSLSDAELKKIFG
jgi:ribose transport system substrate-binding protein